MIASATTPDDAPILLELRRRLDTTDDPVERCSLQIRQALYLVRTERMKEADKLPEQVRSDWEGREELKVFVWLWLFEGVLSLYRDSLTDGRQRLLLAREAALKGSWRAEAELAAAWLAHYAYVDGDYRGMIRNLHDSGLGTAALDESVARSTLTLACALQWFGQEELAQTWFARARDIARSTGDRAGIMAATANRLMLKLSDNWMNLAFGEAPRHAPKPLRDELLGILGYEAISGSASLQEQNEVAMLRLHVLHGEFAQAMALATTMEVAEQRRSAPALAIAGVIRAWLQAQERSSKPEIADLLAKATASFVPSLLDDDDAASCWALLAQVAQRAGLADEHHRLLGLARQARERYQSVMNPLLPELRALEAEAAACWVRG